MILAGEIGATRTRLAAFKPKATGWSAWSQKTYLSQEHDGLSGNPAAVHTHRGHPGSQRVLRRGRAGARWTQQDFESALDHRLRANWRQQLKLPFRRTAQ